jgi:hypothetical protein
LARKSAFKKIFPLEFFLPGKLGFKKESRLFLRQAAGETDPERDALVGSFQGDKPVLGRETAGRIPGRFLFDPVFPGRDPFLHEIAGIKILTRKIDALGAEDDPACPDYSAVHHHSRGGKIPLKVVYQGGPYGKPGLKVFDEGFEAFGFQIEGLFSP